MTWATRPTARRATCGCGAVTGHRGISLSTVREPCEEMGRAAVRAALTLIADPGKGPLIAPIPGNELKARRTTVGTGG